MVTVATPCQSVCTPWATSADLCSPCDEYSTDATLIDNCMQVASDVLFELSGRRWAGVCSDTVRPVLRSSSVDYGRPIRPPYPFGGPYGYWPPAGMGNWQPSNGFWMVNRSNRAGGQILAEITLGVYPLDAITEVKVDGIVLDPSEYRIDDNRWLVRLPDANGQNPGWPGTQDMTLDATEPNTWQVAFLYGSPPPPAGVRAAASLACQLVLACQPETVNGCKLPQRVTSLTRQGMTVAIIDPYDFLDKGRTGIYDVDLFLAAYNPKGLRRRATVMSPDIGRRVRRTGN